MRNGGNKFSSGVDVHLFHRERVLVVANHSKKPKIEIFVKRNQPQSSMTPNLHFFNTLNGDVFKAVFQARPKRPDQGKSSFIYLTIPTPSATEAKESAIHGREEYVHKLCLGLHFDKSIFIPRDCCVGVDTSNAVEGSVVAFQVLTPLQGLKLRWQIEPK